MDRAEARQRIAVPAEEVADLHHVLVERPAADVRMLAPHRVDQRVPAHNHPGIRLEVKKDADLLAPDFRALAVRELDLQPLRVDLAGAEPEGVRSQVGVAGQPLVARRSQAPQDRPQPRAKFLRVVRLPHIVLGARVQGLSHHRWVVERRQHHHRRRRRHRLQPRQHLQPIHVRQREVEQNQVHVLRLQVAQRARPLVEAAARKAVLLQLPRDQGRKGSVVLNEGDQGFLPRAHADLGGWGWTVG